MLIFKLRPGDKVMIGDNIEVTFIRNQGDDSRIGFTAPRSVRIDREVVRIAKDKSARQAANQ